MISFEISEAQANFPDILNQQVLIVDSDTHNKKAVILPYDDYIKLLNNSYIDNKNGSFEKFVGILDENFQIDDIKYNKIVK